MSSPGQIVGDLYPATFTATVIDPPGSGIWRNVTNAQGCYYAPTSLTYNFPAFALGIDNALGCNTTLYSSANYNVIVVNKSPTSSLGLTTQSCTDLYMGIYNFTANGGKYENAGRAVRSLDYGPVEQFNPNIKCAAAAAAASSNGNAQAQSSGTAVGTGTVPAISPSSTSAATNSTASAIRSASTSAASAAIVTTRATSTTSGTRSATSPAAATATTNAADSVTGLTKWAVVLLAGSLMVGI